MPFGHYRKSRGARVCYYCHQPMEWDDPTSPFFRTRDHKIPKSRGGDRRKWGPNSVPACFECNQEKGRMTHEEYFEFREVTKGCKGRKAKMDRWRKHQNLHKPIVHWSW